MPAATYQAKIRVKGVPGTQVDTVTLSYASLTNARKAFEAKHGKGASVSDLKKIG